MTIKLNDLLKPEILGSKFMAIRGYEPVLDRETNQISAYRINVSLQDETSDFYMELIPVKIKNLNPTVTVDSLANAKSTQVILKNLNLGQYNGNPWYSAEDVLPVK